jgi:hypothetical protein
MRESKKKSTKNALAKCNAAVIDGCANRLRKMPWSLIFNDFLILAAIIAALSLIFSAFMLYHAEKQLKDHKKRTDQK